MSSQIFFVLFWWAILLIGSLKYKQERISKGPKNAYSIIHWPRLIIKTRKPLLNVLKGSLLSQPSDLTILSQLSRRRELLRIFQNIVLQAWLNLSILQGGTGSLMSFWRSNSWKCLLGFQRKNFLWKIPSIINYVTPLEN